jgi:outer membrane protein assembly factor BamB
VKKLLLALLPTTVLIFSGCSSKSLYEPSEVSGKVYFDQKLPAEVIKSYRDGALLSNGQIITKTGLTPYVMPKESEFLSETNGTIMGSSKKGIITLGNVQTNETKSYSLDEYCVAGKYDGVNLLALVTMDNTIVIYDTATSKTLFRHKSGKALFADEKIANPIFLGDLVVFATLDGKLIVVDKNEKRIVRDITVSADADFNNVVFFEIAGNRLVAATHSKVISMSPTTLDSLDILVRDILFVNDVLYIFTRDGRIVASSIDLGTTKQMKFPFAHFVGGIYGKYIYGIEKEGYVIAVNHQLSVSNVFKLESEIDSPIFTAQDKVYFDNKIFQLSK